VSCLLAAGSADVIVGVFVEAIEAQNSFSLVLGAGGRNVERQPFIAAAEALPVATVMRIPACSIIIGSLFVVDAVWFSINRPSCEDSFDLAELITPIFLPVKPK
jgi:hypothetical protein